MYLFVCKLERMFKRNSSRMKFIYLMCGLFLLIQFQNCAAKNGDEDVQALPAAAPEEVLECSLDSSSSTCVKKSCTFDANSVSHGDTVVAFQNSEVSFGESCISENRVCDDGALSGSYVYATCQVAGPASCLFNTKTISHMSNTLAFQNSTVPYGSACTSEFRECSNGALGGSYSYAHCTVESPANCLFNGQSIPHNGSVVAFGSSTMPFGSQCQAETRVCSNGVLSGSATFGSCNIESPQSCLFNGQSIAHGQELVGFQTSSVPFGVSCSQQTRVCDNGILSGEYEYASCNIEGAKSCLFNGQTIAHGQNIQAFQSSSVAFNGSCLQETRTCRDGVLSGNFIYETCVVAPAVSCTFNGQEVFHGSTVTAYLNSSVASGESCTAETRSCDNGSLSGSYSYLNCVGSPPPAGSCEFSGNTVLVGASVIAYQSASVPYGTSCISESRTCNGGALSGSFTYASCSIQSGLSCVFNGQGIPHGEKVTAYRSDQADKKGNCNSQTRVCKNGSLSGGFRYSMCQ